jgi:predicted short-subunit dehydrogenase-like oxidoreductase (DUF2520 family)
MRAEHPSRFSLVGAGGVASSIGSVLVAQGWRAIGVFGRTPASSRAAALATQLSGDSGLALDAAVQASDLVIIAVPDRQVPEIAQELADTEVEWAEKTVFHTSGVLDSMVLAPLSERGAATIAVHPLQSFTSPSDAAALQGIFVTLQGSSAGRLMMRSVFEEAGATVIAVSSEDRVAVHAAATMVSNYTVAVSSLARELLRTTSISQSHVASMLQPLLQGTVQNIAEKGVDAALTGPIVRGDAETIARHVEYIARTAPHLMTVYVALATETVRLARGTARLSGSDAIDILDTVVDALPIGPASEDP